MPNNEEKKSKRARNRGKPILFKKHQVKLKESDFKISRLLFANYSNGWYYCYICSWKINIYTILDDDSSFFIRSKCKIPFQFNGLLQNKHPLLSTDVNDAIVII